MYRHIYLGCKEEDNVQKNFELLFTSLALTTIELANEEVVIDLIRLAIALQVWVCVGFIDWQFICVIGETWGFWILILIGNLIILSELDCSLRKCTLYVPLTDAETTSNQFYNKVPQYVLFRKSSRCGNFLKHFLVSLILSRLTRCSLNPWSCVLYKMYGLSVLRMKNTFFI